MGVVLTEQGKLGGKVETCQPLLWVYAHMQETLDNALIRLAGA